MPVIRYDLEAVDRGFGSVMATGANAAGALSAALIGAAAATKGLLDEVFGQVDAMNTAAAATGLTIKSIKGLELAAKAANKEVGSLVPRDLAKRISEVAMGTGEALTAFEELGVAATNADGSLRSTDDVLFELLGTILEIENPTERAALAVRSIGEEGKEMLSAFSDVSDLDRFVRLGEEFGIKVGPEAVAQSNAWWAATSNLQLALDDTAQTLADVAAPAATAFVNNFTLGFLFIKEVVVEVFDEVRNRFIEIGEAAAALRRGDLSALADLFDTPSEAVGRFSDAITRAKLTAQDFWSQTMEPGAEASERATRDVIVAVEEMPEALEEATESVAEFMDAWADLDDQMQDIGRTIDATILQYERDTAAFEKEQEQKKAAFKKFAFDTLTAGASSFATLADLAHESALSQVEAGGVASAAQREQIQKTFKTSQNAARAEVFFNAAAAFASLLVTFAALGYGAPIAAASITVPMVVSQLAVIDSQKPATVRHSGGLATDELRSGGMRVLQGEGGFVFNRQAVRDGALTAARAVNERRTDGGGGAQLVLADAGRAVAVAMMREERRLGSEAFRAKSAGQPRARVNPYRRS